MTVNELRAVLSQLKERGYGEEQVVAALPNGQGWTFAEKVPMTANLKDHKDKQQLVALILDPEIPRRYR